MEISIYAAKNKTVAEKPVTRMALIKLSRADVILLINKVKQHSTKLINARKTSNRKNFIIFLLLKKNLKRIQSVHTLPIKVEIMVAKTIPYSPKFFTKT